MFCLSCRGSCQRRPYLLSALQLHGFVFKEVGHQNPVLRSDRDTGGIADCSRGLVCCISDSMQNVVQVELLDTRIEGVGHINFFMCGGQRRQAMFHPERVRRIIP